MEVGAVERTFGKLRKNTDLWFPYPIIQENDLKDRKRRMLLFGDPPRDTTKSSFSSSTWQGRVRNVYQAAMLVEPWAMRTWQVMHFLGYREDAVYLHEHAFWYDDALEEAIKMLPPWKFEEYAACDKGVELSKTDFDVTREVVSTTIILANRSICTNK